MPLTPLILPNTLTGTFMSPRSLSYLHNYYNVNGFLLPREGMEMTLEYNTGSNPTGANDWKPRGIFASRGGTVYSVFGSRLYVDDTGLTEIEAMTVPAAGTGERCYGATGFTGVALSTGSKNYFIDPAQPPLLSVSEITDADLPDETDGVVYLNGRYVWLTAEAMYFSAVDDATTIEATSFFDAEAEPDQNRALAVLGNELYVFGTHTIERFRNAGDASLPFQRIGNAVIPVGYAGGLLNLSDRIIFIGRTKTTGNRVYEIVNGSIREISNDTVNEILNNEQLINGLSTTSASGVFNQMCSSSFNAYGKRVIVLSSSFTDADTDISLYAMQDGDGYNWGFLSDNPENAFSQFDEWGLMDFDYTRTDFSRRWTFAWSVSVSGFTYFQRGGSLDAAGIYKKADRFKSFSDQGPGNGYMNDWIVKDSGTVEAVSRGFKAFYRAPVPKTATDDIKIDAIEISFSKQGMYRKSSNSNPSGGDSGDTVNLRVSDSGVGWGYGISGETEGREWSSKKTQAFGDLGDSGRLRIQPTGGIIRNHEWLGLIVQSDADIPFTIERVFLDV